MTRVDSMDMLRARELAFRRATPSYETNMMLPAENLEQAVSEGRLSIREDGHSLSLYIAPQDTAVPGTLFYCYVDALENLRPSEGKEPLYVEVINREKAQRRWRDALSAVGAVEDITYIQMKASTGQLWQGPGDGEDEKNFLIHYATAGETVALHDFFDPIRDRLPGRDTLSHHLSERGSLIAVDSKSGKQAGFLLYKNDGASSTLEHIAVYPDFRRRGVAEGMMARYLQDTGDAVSNYSLWVRQENVGARALYEKFGYTASALEKRIYRIDKIRQG